MRKHLRKNLEKEADYQASRNTVTDAQRESTLNFQCSSQTYNLDLTKPCSDSTFLEADRILSTTTGSDASLLLLIILGLFSFNTEDSKVQYVF